MELQSFLPNSRYEILTLKGTLVSEGDLDEKKKHICTDDLKKGYYFVRIINNKQTYTITVVI